MIDNEDKTIPRPATTSEDEQGAAPDAPVTQEQTIEQNPVVAPEPTTEEHATVEENQASEQQAIVEQPQTNEASTIQVPTDTVSPAPAAKPFLSVEDLLGLRIVSDPQIAPDGSLIAFTLQQNDSNENATNSSIWLVSSMGGKAQSAWQITSGGQHDFMPRWSPDGRNLAFLSDRSGKVQLHLLPMQGGEARQISNLPQGVTAYNWRPDGQMLLAQGAWKPADDREEEEGNTVGKKPMIYTRLDAHWDGTGHKQGRHQQLWLVPLEDETIRLTSEPVDLTQANWSPDGTEIAFCANRRSDPDLSASMAVWVLTLATGQMRRLTPEEGLAMAPVWSPDGQSIAYLYSADQSEAGNLTPWIVQASGNGTPELAVPGAEEIHCQAIIIDELRTEWTTTPEWYPDGKALLVTTQERGQVHLCRLDLVQKSISRLTSGNGRYVSPQISNNGTVIAMIRADWFTPGDVWGMDGDGKNLRKLTRANDAFLQSRQLIRPKRITWQSFDGLEIEGWLYLPPLPEQSKAPLILAVHGGPTLAWGDAYVHEFQVLAGRGYAVLAPNPRGSSGYGEEFCRKVINDWGGDDFRDLMAGIDYVAATEPVDGERVGIGGLSYGGYMTNWALSQTDRFKAGVSRNSVSSIVTAGLLSDQTVWFSVAMNGEELQRERSALTFVDQVHTPLLLLHAGDDLRCPFSESLQLFTALRKRKQKVELVRYPDVSHLIDWPDVGTPEQRVDRIRRSVDWFEHFV